MKGRAGLWLVGVLTLTACPDEEAPRPAGTAAIAPEAIPTEADFAEAVGSEITDENFEAKLTEIEAAIQSDKSK